MSDADNPYWVHRPDVDTTDTRVRVRYVVPSGLPLWLGAPGSEVLADLSVSRARDGTVFHVTPEQWDSVLAAIGGWPTISPDVDEAVQVLNERSGRIVPG